MNNRLSVERAAELLDASPQFIRIGLQNKELPFGFAVKMSSQYNYVIPIPLFEQCTGIKVDES